MLITKLTLIVSTALAIVSNTAFTEAESIWLSWPLSNIRVICIFPKKFSKAYVCIYMWNWQPYILERMNFNITISSVVCTHLDCLLLPSTSIGADRLVNCASRKLYVIVFASGNSILKRVFFQELIQCGVIHLCKIQCIIKELDILIFALYISNECLDIVVLFTSEVKYLLDAKPRLSFCS